MSKRENSRPTHSQVNWDHTEMRAYAGRQRLFVEVVCPDCAEGKGTRMVEASRVAQRVQWGLFSGRCRKHQHRWVTPALYPEKPTP